MPIEHSTLSVGSTTTSDLNSELKDYSVSPQSTDAISESNETRWVNDNWSKQYGYYSTIPELQKAINALATWTLGKGYTTDARTKVLLDNITGWGEDTFNSIMWNLFVTKKISGDAFAEIIRDPDTGILVNLKPLDPGSIGIVVDKKGMIKRYEQLTKTGKKTLITATFRPDQILHLCNERIADNIHGTSVIDACEWVILARNEAMDDWKKVLHRNVVPLRIIEVDSDDTAKLASLKTQYQTAIKNGEVLIIPKGNVEIKDSTAVMQDSLSWIRYQEDFFYQAVGVPKVILGGGSDFTESASKISYLTFSQVYEKEQREFEADLWNQAYLKISLGKPASLQNEMLSDDSKDGRSKEMGFQPSDLTAGAGE